MSVQRKQFEIDGATYDLQQLGGFKTLRVWNRLARCLVPAVSKLQDVGSIEELSLASLGDALGGALDGLDESALEALTRDLLAGATVTDGEGHAILLNVFDRHFAGRSLTILKVLKEAIMFNYSDFLGGGLGQLRAMAEAGATQSA